jgi:hypothetical protein
MRNDPCSIATEYADRMSKCTTIVDLEAIGAEIKGNLAAVLGFESWLRDWYSSCLKTIKEIENEVQSDKEQSDAGSRGGSEVGTTDITNGSDRGNEHTGGGDTGRGDKPGRIETQRQAIEA